MSVRRRDRVRGPGAGDLHADAGLHARVRGVPGQGAAGLRGRLMCSSWPFFEDSAPRRSRRAARVPEVAETELDDRCRAFVRALAADGWLAHCVGSPLDVRTLCLARETLAYHDALADFAFAMQGLGAGPITLFGDDELRAEYLPAVARGREDRGVRAVGAGGGLGRRGDDDGRRRRSHHRREDLDLQRRDRGLLHRLRARARGHQRLRGRRVRGRGRRAHRRDRAAPAGDAALRRRARRA